MLQLMSNINCICVMSSSVELSNCCRNWSLDLGSGSAAKSLKVFSLLSLAALRLLSVDSLAVEHGEEIGGCNTLPDNDISLINSFWLTKAEGRPLYPGFAMLEKDCGTL